MNKLWIFGDSFSSNFNLKNAHENVTEYLKLFQKDSMMHWPEILSEKLNYQLVNHAMGGNSNYQIFQDFCDQCHLIKENDIVIIGWGLIEKFRISHNNKFINIHPSNQNSHGMISKTTIDSVLENRSQFLVREVGGKIDRWAWEVYGWETAMHVLSKNKNFKIYFWSTEEPRLIYAESEDCKSKKNYLCKESKKPLIIHLRELGCLTISDETNNLIGDTHFGILGHEMQAEIFYKELENK
jgi:hypothetical protein